MKRILFLLLLIINYSFFIGETNAQWDLKSNTEDGKYSNVTNSSEFFGVSGGSILAQSVFALTTSDTSIWRLVTNTDNGLYSLVENKVSFMGIDSGKIKTKAIYILNPSTLSSLGLDTNRLAYTGKANFFTGRMQTFDTVNAAVRYLLNGVNINTAGTLSNVAYLNQANSFIGRKQTFDTVNATVKYLLNGADINTNGTLSNIPYMNGRPVFSDLVTFSDSTAMITGYFTMKNSAGIRFTKSLTLTDTLYSAFLSTGNYVAGNGRQSNLTLDNTGSLNFSGRIQLISAGDGIMNVLNWAGNNWSKFELGTSANTTGFYHGTLDTDITAVYLRSPNGTLWYLTINDAGTVVTSTTAP